jgi:hypothetical protein
MGQMAAALERWWVAQGFPDVDAVQRELEERV